MINVLFLPHAFPHAKLKTRTGELTRELAKDPGFSVFVLSRAASPLQDLKYGLKHGLARATTAVWREEEGHLTYLKIPFIPGAFPGLYLFNRRLLEKALRAFDIHVVINSFAHSLSVPPSPDRVSIYDLADDYAGFHGNPLIKALVSSYIRRESRGCDALTTVSLTLGERIRARGWKRDFTWLPNGVSADRFQESSPQAGEPIRTRFGLRDKIVIGHIGSQDRFSGLDFLLDVFNKAQTVEPRLALLVVGPGDEAERLGPLYASNPNVVFAGPVDPAEISPYFAAADVGVLPYAPLPSVHSRFPLRLAEFTAARKIVVAWPFGDLARLRLPNVVLAKRTPEAWVDALLRSKDLAWNPRWEDLRREFSIARVVSRLKELIFKLLKDKGLSR